MDITLHVEPSSTSGVVTRSISKGNLAQNLKPNPPGFARTSSSFVSITTHGRKFKLDRRRITAHVPMVAIVVIFIHFLYLSTL